MGVTINPESRVKVGYGGQRRPAALGQDRLLLVKVHNEAGVTHALAVSGTQIRDKSESGEGAGWTRRL